jgi:hypothetical protein
MDSFLDLESPFLDEEVLTGPPTAEPERVGQELASYATVLEAEAVRDFDEAIRSREEAEQELYQYEEFDRDAETWSESEEPSATDTPGLVTFTGRTLPIRVSVLATKAARQASQVEVLVFVHGLDVCGPVLKPRPQTFITERPFKLGALVEDSGRPIVLIVPFLDWENLGKNNMGFGHKWHKLAQPENLNGVVAEALEQVGTPTIQRLVLAGHSRAFGVFDALAKAHANPEMANGALGCLSHVWALDSTYTSPVTDWMGWLRSRNDLQIKVIYRYGRSRQPNPRAGVEERREADRDPGSRNQSWPLCDSGQVSSRPSVFAADRFIERYE